MKNLTSYLRLVSVMSMILFMVACQPKGDDKKTASTPGYGPGGYIGACMGCAAGWGGGQNFVEASAYGSYSAPMSMTIRVAGDMARLQQLQMMTWPPAKHYQGQAYLSGAAIQISTPIYAGQCMIPAGRYDLVAYGSSNAGMYDRGMFNFPAFALQGASGQVVVTISQGVMVDQNADGHIAMEPQMGEGFGGYVFFMQSNGYPCNDSIGIYVAP